MLLLHLRRRSRKRQSDERGRGRASFRRLSILSKYVLLSTFRFDQSWSANLTRDCVYSFGRPLPGKEVSRSVVAYCETSSSIAFSDTHHFQGAIAACRYDLSILARRASSLEPSNIADSSRMQVLALDALHRRLCAPDVHVRVET